jgi:hypothetical protein
MIEEPLSFVDLKKRFTKKSDDPLKVHKDITVPIYVVNKMSGTLSTFTTATFHKGISRKEYCSICIWPLQITFFVRNEDKNNNKLVNIKWGSFYSGNYELFLSKKEAAIYSINILKEKRNKIDEKINELMNSINNI